MEKTIERRPGRIFAILAIVAAAALIICSISMCRADNKLDERAKEILGTMTTKQKVGQVIFVGAPAKSAKQMKKMQYGGYIFFAYGNRNYKQGGDSDDIQYCRCYKGDPEHGNISSVFQLRRNGTVYSYDRNGYSAFYI